MDGSVLYRRAVELLPRLGLAVRRRWHRHLLQFPRILSVELTNRCKARCIMSSRQAMIRPQGLMDPELYLRILTETSRHQDSLQLFQPVLFGEALLHPRFPDLVRTTREFLDRSRITISTNGALLDEGCSEAILDARIDKLTIDIDGVTPETAGAIRRHISLSKVQANVERFLVLRNRRRSPTRVWLTINRLPQNRHEIDAFVAYWKPLADHVQVVDFNNWLGISPENLRVAPEPIIPFDFPCMHPYEELAIAWDGRAALCCLDFDLGHPVGNVSQESIRRIWRGGAINAARKALEAGRYEDVPICRACYAAKFQQKGLWRRLWQIHGALTMPTTPDNPGEVL